MSRNDRWILICAVGLVGVLGASGISGCADDTTSGGGGGGGTSGADTQEEIDFRTSRDTSGGGTSDVDSDTSGGGSCQPSCQNASTAIVCVDGQATERACVSGEVCSGGGCRATICSVPGLPYACDGDQVRVCNPDQVSFTLQPCQNPEHVCTGAGTCAPANAGCSNGTFDCRTNEPPLLCVDGAWVPQPACGDKEVCTPTGCQSLCELNNKTSSFLGCDYYVVDMDNSDTPSTWATCTSTSQCAQGDVCVSQKACCDFFSCYESCTTDTDCTGSFESCDTTGSSVCTQPSHDDQTFGVTISNPNFTHAANVTISGGGMATPINVNVLPGQLQVVPLPSDTDADSGGLFINKTFFAKSDVPVTMHQFNPLNGDGVFSNDASLLLPTNSLGSNYIVLNNPVATGSATGTQGAPAYVDIVATEDNTQLTIISPIDIPDAQPFGAITRNVPKSITMNKGNIFHLVTPNTLNSDVSGMDITSDKNIAVFAGVVCANVPNRTHYCDHIEQQLFPVSTWGTEYFAAKSRSRGAEPDVWRIIASQDGTQVTFSNSGAPITLNKGQVHQLNSIEDFKISANNPILVGQFLTGSNYPGIPQTCGFPCRTGGDCGAGGTCTEGECRYACTGTSTCNNISSGGTCNQGFCAWSGIGDPAFTLAVPIRQYRTSYTVLTPPGYKENYLTIITPTGTRPQLNGGDISGNPVTVDGMDIYRLSVPEGVQQLQNNAPFGVIAYGYDCDVSYAYPGGLNLETIN
jgi:hypothetical protein